MDPVRVILVLVTAFVGVSAMKVKMNQDIIAVGFPYYKLLFSLGDCKEITLFNEELIWKVAKLNRVLDIHYESSNPKFAVSKAEIYLVINNTDCFAFSESGIGHTLFTAVLYLPTKISIMFYHLILYTCSTPIRATSEKFNEFDVDSKESETRIPGIGPDGEPLHIINRDEN